MQHVTIEPMYTSYVKIIVRSIYVVMLVVGAVWLSSQLARSETFTAFVASFGYVGVAIAALVNSFNIFFPVPISTFAPVFLASGLETLPLAIAIACGMTLGDFIGYFLGNVSRRIVASRKHGNETVEKIERMFLVIESFKHRHHIVPYVLLALYASLAPTPNELIIIPMAFAGYKLRYIFPIAFLGNIFHTSAVMFGVLNLVPFF